MGLKTITLPSGRQYTYDDSNIPKQPSEGKYYMQAAAPLATLLGYRALAGNPMSDETGGLLGYIGDSLKGSSVATGKGSGLTELGAGLGTTGAETASEALPAGLDFAGTLTGAPEASLSAGYAGAGEGGALGSSTGLGAETGFGAYALPAAATLAGGYGLYDVMSNQNRPRWQSALEGGLALPALGWGAGGLLSAAGLLSTNPVTLPIGLGLGALGLLGGGLLGGHKSTKQRRQESHQDIVDLGVKGYDPNFDASGQGSANYGKPPVISSLKPVDIEYTDPMYAQYRDKWMELPDEKRIAVAKAVLDAGAYRQERGVDKVDWSNPNLQAKLQELGV